MDILILVLVGAFTALISLSGGFLMLLNSRLAKVLEQYGSAIATLVLVAAVMFDLLPEAVRSLELWQALLLVLSGFFGFFLVGFFAGRFHKHGEEGVLRNRRRVVMMILVDGLHTALDGIVLGAAFAAGFSTGIWAAVAIAAHEIPRGISDFAIMVRSKVPKRRILRVQMGLSLLLVPAAVGGWLFGDGLTQGLPAVLAVIAGLFLYIAYGEARGILGGWRSKKQ